MSSQFSPFRVLIFLVIVGIVNTLASVFLYLFVAKIVGGVAGLKSFVFAGIWGVMPFFILAQVGRRFWGWPSWVFIASTVLLGSFSIAVAMAVIGYGLIWAGMSAPIVGGVFGVATVALSGVSVVTHLRGPKLVSIDLSEAPAFSVLERPLTVVHLTDIHLTSYTRHRWIDTVVTMVNRQNPDFILFTGDLIDVDPDLIPEKIKLLSQLKANYGKFAVSGNHDFMTGISKFYRLCADLGFRVLDHDFARECGVTFVGVPDEMSASFGQKASDIGYLNTISSPGPMILLKHRPTLFRRAVSYGVSLQLSGHSHNGQLPPWGILVALRYFKYAYGLHRFKKSFIYTSCGTGVWGPPMRLFGRSEIVVFRLGKSLYDAM